MRIDRHKTAIGRVELSKPVRLALENSILSTNDSFFDYGCGRGTDVQMLRAMQYGARGWDPASFPREMVTSAEIVNIGYVLNVIEDFVERADALKRAWDLAGKALLVAARSTMDAPSEDVLKPYRDGFLTSRGTFQKFYNQTELREWIQGITDCQPYPLAPGIFVLFRDEDLKQRFLESRYRRRRAAPTIRLSDRLFAEHQARLQTLMDFVTQRGRLPEAWELDSVAELVDIFGSLKKAFLIVRRVTGEDQWETIRQEVKNEIRIQLALDRFDGRPKFGQLPRALQHDVKALFSSYTAACQEADDLLFSVGDLKAVQEVMADSTIGKLTGNAFYIHRDALSEAPTLLRIYEGCARGYIGDVEGANVIKLRRDKPKVSYLAYPDFDRDPHPVLVHSTVVGLQSFKIRQQDYTKSPARYILHRKEEFLGAGDPRREKFARLTQQEEKAGLFDETTRIGERAFWDQLLFSKGLKLKGHRLVKAAPSA
jgi:DNA phosphorothioation-associated putative methyltransferase